MQHINMEASSLEDLKASIAVFRHLKFLEAVKKMGHHFNSQEELEKFEEDRITVAIDEGNGRYIVLDYQKPSQIVLAFHADQTEVVEDKLLYPDWYFEGTEEEIAEQRAVFSQV